MVDGLLLHGFFRWLGSVQRGATSLAYWGIFSIVCNAARTNPLISYYGIFRWQISVPLQAFSPYIFSPRFFGGCIIRLADWTCFSHFIGSADWDRGLPHR